MSPMYKHNTTMCSCLRVQVSAICVNVKATDQATLVSFAPYFEGSAPFLMVNNTKGLTFKVEQIHDRFGAESQPFRSKQLTFQTGSLAEEK